MKEHIIRTLVVELSYGGENKTLTKEIASLRFTSLAMTLPPW